MLFLLKTLFYIDVLLAAGLMLFRWALLPRYRTLVSGKLAAIALTTPAVALLCGNVNLFFLYLAVVVAFSARTRLETAGVYLFLLPSTPFLSNETSVGSLYLFSFSTLVAMGLGALIALLITRAQPTRPRMKYEAAIYVLVGIFLFIYNRNLNPTELIRGLAIQVVTLLVPYLLVSRAARDGADVERLLLRLSLGATLMAVTVCFQAWRHWVLFEAYTQALKVPIPLSSAATALRAGFLRTGGSMVDYSAGGLFLATMVTTLPLLRRAFRSAGFWLVMGTLVLALFFTQSRGAWVAAGAGLIAVAAWRGRWGMVVGIGGGALIADLMAALLPESGRLAQLLGKTGHAATTSSYRADLFTQGLAQIKGHPLFGQTPAQLGTALSDLTQGEHIVDFVNTHLYIAMAAGIPLFLAWCAIWLMPIVDGWRHRKHGYPIAAVPTAIIAPAMVALAFTSMGDRNLTWPVLALALASPCSSRRRAPRRAAQQGQPSMSVLTPAPISARPGWRGTGASA